MLCSPALHSTLHVHCSCRFQEAVELLASDSDDSMWVRLHGAHVPDSKVAKVGAAVSLSGGQVPWRSHQASWMRGFAAQQGWKLV